MILWRTLLDFPLIPYVLSAVGALTVFFSKPSWLATFYEKLATEFPSPLYTVMGFIITAASIIVAIHENGRMQELSEERPELWRQLIRLFTITAGVSGAFATALIFTDQSTVAKLDAITARVIYSFAVAVFIFLILQVATSIYALERFATAERPSKQGQTPRKKYVPPDWSTREAGNDDSSA